MKLFSHTIRFIFMLVLFTILLVSCAPKKAEMSGGEALKVAAKDFQPTLMNLDGALKSGDMQAARDTLAMLNQKLDKIKAAEVPVRLAESADKVTSQVDALSISLEELTSAITQPELAEIDTTILNQFTTVRTNFAKLGSLLRVKIPELSAFHDVLYVAWHDYYANDAIDSTKAIVPQFKEKAAALDNVQWPGALQDNLDAIKMKVKDLQQSVADLEAACQGDDTEAIKKTVEVLHEKYIAVNRML